MSARDCILVTGAAGFIGSHFCRLAIESGSRVIALDDFSAHSDSARRGWLDKVMHNEMRHIGGIDEIAVHDIIRTYKVTAVVHFAGDICVADSVRNPARYFDRNVIRALKLLDAVVGKSVSAFVFSSSAAVYGIPDYTPIIETARCEPINPYGATKLAFEHALAAYGKAYGIRWAALRYFNAAGAHPDGTMREQHNPETHLIPLTIDAALGRGPELTVFGDEHDTRDGTCIRDYVHVMDLAQAHLDALDALDRSLEPIGAVNLGSEHGYTVLEVISSVRRALCRPVPYKSGPRRDGDPATLVASLTRARDVLGWRPKRSDIETIIEDAIRSRRS